METDSVPEGGPDVSAELAEHPVVPDIIPPLNTCNDLIGAILLLHERAQSDPEFRRTLGNYQIQEGIDTRIPFRGTDEDFEFLVNCLVEKIELEKECEELKKELGQEKSSKKFHYTPLMPTYPYTHLMFPMQPVVPNFFGVPGIVPKTEPTDNTSYYPGIDSLLKPETTSGSSSQLDGSVGYNAPSTSTSTANPWPFMNFPTHPISQYLEPPLLNTAGSYAAPTPVRHFNTPKDEELQDELQYMDIQIDEMAKIHEKELLDMKLDKLVQAKQWEDKYAKVKEDNELLEMYCQDAEMAKAEVEETLEKKNERIRQQVEKQSIKDWKMVEIQTKMDEKDAKIRELEERLSSMQSSTSCELEQLRAQLSKMVVDPTEKRKKPRISESQPSTSDAQDGWSRVDDSGDVWVYGEDAAN